MQAAVELVHVEPSVGRYMIDIVRRRARARASPSARARVAASRCSSSSRCRAALAGRDFVTPGRRQGGRGAGARAPAPPQARAVGAAAQRRGRRPRDARGGADAVGRGRRPPAPAPSRRDAVRIAAARVVPRSLRRSASSQRSRSGGRSSWSSQLRSRSSSRRDCCSRARPRCAAWLHARSRPGRSRETRSWREIELNATTAVDLLELHLVLPDGLAVVEGDNPCACGSHADEERTLPLTLRCERWGSVELGDIRLRARGRDRDALWEGRVRRPHQLSVYPRPELLQSLVAPLETQLVTGDLVARIRADGLEFADTRAFVPGDRLRSVNWRASARRGELIVNERHPDRNADVVLFLDSFAEARSGDEARRHARARRASRGNARGPPPRAPRPGRARHLRRHPPLARARLRPRPALPPHRRPARDGRRVQLRLEGRQRDPGTNAAAEGARDRRDPVARRALDRRPARPRAPAATTSA